MKVLTRSVWIVGARSFSLPDGPDEYPRWNTLPCSRLAKCLMSLFNDLPFDLASSKNLRLFVSVFCDVLFDDFDESMCHLYCIKPISKMIRCESGQEVEQRLDDLTIETTPMEFVDRRGKIRWKCVWEFLEVLGTSKRNPLIKFRRRYRHPHT